MKLFKTLICAGLLSLTLFSCGGSDDIGQFTWKVRSINGAPATKEQLAELTLKFGKEQKVNGQAPCDEFRGKAVYNAEKIKFSTLYTDSQNCDEKTIQTAYLSSLEMSKTYTTTANRMVFYDGDGNITVEFEQVN
ncbi:META domain-containing protein [Echinicola vietnamensis]|uniref:META domain protein n=1 Tax=Echinicola vietnamensis (strain DSM 17526 / LMG 23754 / KMM 6221) TaxID=926556 RepID=L0FV80_ECHVK|nr:META domain-containing protein [Echinicola vietnamensis]AGA77809.1 META domain protein [Echinicola vietnamensis DSM 17526]